MPFPAAQATPSEPAKKEMNRLLKRIYLEVKALLNEKRAGVEAIAQALLEHNDLTQREVAELLGEPPPPISPTPPGPAGADLAPAPDDSVPTR
jgi:hypothetical protein